MLFVRDVRQMAEKAAPFLTFDSQPYAVIANGEVQYVLDGYTTTSQYPYCENASNLNVNMGGLPSSFNYARNAVKVVVNAYTGAMKFYANDPNDPILKAYRSAFPKMFLPMSAMPSTIRTHLRYPSRPLLGAGRDLRALPHHLGERLLLGFGPLGDLADDRRGLTVPVARAHREDQRGRHRALHVAQPDEPALPGGLPAERQPPAAARDPRLRARGQLFDGPEPHRLHDRDK